MNKQDFYTDLPIHPGEHLQDTIDEMKITQTELANRLGMSRKVINEIINGKAPITPSTAYSLERVLNIPVHFWNNLQNNYDLNLAWLSEQKRLESEIKYLTNFPIRLMQKYKWIESSTSKIDQVKKLQHFFSVNSLKKIEQTLAVQFRQSQRPKISIESVYAWIRQGERIAISINTEKYNKKKLLGALHQLRSLTLKTPDIFIPQMQKICAQSGIAIVLVKELPNTHINGATFWLQNRSKAVVLLSLRFKSNDQFWFSFFHELGHIFLHQNITNFIDLTNEYMDNDRQNHEDAANKFAADLLIHPDDWQEFCRNNQFTYRNVSDFAEQIQIAPGIVVGRLQKENRIPYTHLNKLKLKYQWD